MSDLLVAMLPPVPGEVWNWRECAAELAAYGYQVSIVSPIADQADGELDLAGLYVAHCALALAKIPGRPPTLLAAFGGAGRMVAALGFAQRAARRKVVGYALIEAELPTSGVQDWPDAPVTYIGEREAVVAGLRGWDVLSGQDPAADLRQVAAACG